MTVLPSTAENSTALLPQGYLERVYAGILGKLIGVYLGRPFEGWTFERIMADLGEINYYVHEQLGVPLVVADDDITGTFAFLRALEDSGVSKDLTARGIGHTWLNALIEGQTVLWWGGYGMSTEHTAYLNLKRGIEAPRSGSIAQNGHTVAEQIGAQIFADGWALVSPGQPRQAADFAKRAAQVSHDGEAVYAAQALAAMEARAFLTSHVPELLETALSVIPEHSRVSTLIQDVQALHATEPDWHVARTWVAEHYGYDRYPGNCHVIPNHALIILALLYGEGDFQRSMRIVNTSGWDTDCNAGNLGCLLGIMHGLEGLDAGPDWRTPVADQAYLPTAEGGRAVTDAVQLAVWVSNLGRALQGLPPLTPKNGARFHFDLPGSVQGFRMSQRPASLDAATVGNVHGHSQSGERSLRVRYQALAPGRRAQISTPTFSPAEALAFNDRGPYRMIASPTLYPGQELNARLEADTGNLRAVRAALMIEHLDGQDQRVSLTGPFVILEPGAAEVLSWTIPDLGGQPVTAAGLQLEGVTEAGTSGDLYLDWLDWNGTPRMTLTAPADGGNLWRQAWVKAVDLWDDRWGDPFRLIQNEGRGLISQGTRDWTDYRAETLLRPELCAACGLGVRVQGLRRYYALLLVPGGVQLTRMNVTEEVLAQRPFEWRYGGTYHLAVEAEGQRLRAWVDGTLVFDLADPEVTLTGGAVALLIEQGMVTADNVHVRPL